MGRSDIARALALLPFAAGALGFAALALSGGASAVEGRALPAPAVDEAPAPSGGLRKAVFAGGCFWGVQGVFQHVEGVTDAVSGYAGGDAGTARYEEVGTGATGHAEAVEVTYDPARVSYGELLRIHMSVAHDPTQLDRQGPDVGPQYRSAVFAGTPEQASIAKAYVAQLEAAGSWGGRIVTEVEEGRAFFRAEDRHQDFLARNPGNRYVAVHDLPKLGELERLFPGRYREDPALTATWR